MIAMPRISLEYWHLLVLFAVVSVVEWTGASLREWAGDKLVDGALR